MLVLSRKVNESIHLDREIRVTVLEVRGSRVRLGIEAPRHVSLMRSEVWVDRPESDSLTATGA
jgi:carbon storage regulator